MKNTKLPQISDAEWTIMKEVWKLEPVTANQVVAALKGKVNWKPKTIQTLLTRLASKGALQFEKKGREYHFSSLVSEADCAHDESRWFLAKVFDGELAPFLANFLQKERLSKKELAELKRILNERSS